MGCCRVRAVSDSIMDLLALRPARLMFSAPWRCIQLPQLREVCTSTKRNWRLLLSFRPAETEKS